MARARERGDAFDRDRRGAGAGDFRAHGVRQLARSTTSGSRAALPMTVVPLARRRRHHHHVGGADRNLREGIARADQAALRRRRVDIAAIDFDLGAERRQALEEKIDRPRADGAAARQRNAGRGLRAPGAGR